MIQIKDKNFELFIKRTQIEKRVKELAALISEHYQNADPLFLPLLNGAFLFAAELIKKVSIPCEVTFIKTKSYNGMQSVGKLTRLLGLDISVEGRNVILVDDIVDTGFTMNSVFAEIKKENPKSIEIATLLYKPHAIQKQLDLKYVGFTIPNNFVVGYGLDYDGHGRNLKDIYQIKN